MVKHATIAVTLVLVVVILVAVVSQLNLTWNEPHQVYMIIPDIGGSVGSTSQPVHVSDNWQVWTVRFKDGHSQTFQSDKRGLTFQVGSTTVSGQPSALEIQFSIQLTFKLRSEDNWPWYKWEELLKIDPTMTLLVDGRAVGAVTSFSSIVFTTKDSVSTIKSWKVLIQFQGTAGSFDGPILNAQNALQGKQTALIQIVWNELYIQYRAWVHSAASRSCAAILIGGSNYNCLDELSRKMNGDPYAIAFGWTPTISGTATFTAPTPIITTDNGGNIVVVHTVTGTQTFTLWSTVRVTLAGPTETVTVTVGTNPGGTNASNSTGEGDWCGKTDGLSKFVCWLYGSTCLIHSPVGCAFSIANYWFVLAALVAVAIVILLSRR